MSAEEEVNIFNICVSNFCIQCLMFFVYQILYISVNVFCVSNFVYKFKFVLVYQFCIINITNKNIYKCLAEEVSLIKHGISKQCKECLCIFVLYCFAKYILLLLLLTSEQNGTVWCALHKLCI